MSEAVVRLGARGDGVTASGRFVPGAVPGDMVAADGTVSPGPNHVAPVCRHVPECGGCILQHFADAAYADWMAERIGAALAGAGIAAGDYAPAHLSPPRSRRRASLRAVKRDGRLVLGFNADASHRIVDLIECHVLLPELAALVAPLRTLLGAALRDGQGAGVSMTRSEAGIDLLLSNVAAGSLREIERLTAFASAHDLVRLSVENAQGIETIIEARTPVVTLGGAAVALPPAAFLQATLDGEAALQAAVLDAAAGAARVADLFCGVGTFALPLARAGARVTAADAAKAAVDALGAAARGAGLRVETLHRDLFRAPLGTAELAGFDAVVADPPRAGAAAQAAELARSRVPTIVMVSCNPNTFARDAAMLCEAGYRLGRVWPVGQFRWSPHIELVARFAR